MTTTATAALPGGGAKAATPDVAAVSTEESKAASEAAAKPAAAAASEPTPTPAASPAVPAPAPVLPVTPTAAPVIGRGFHVFDANYLYLGAGFQGPCQAYSLEGELSFVPFISDGMWWFGFYAAAGGQWGRRPPHVAPSNSERCFGESTTPTPIGTERVRAPVPAIQYRREEPTPNADYDIGGARLGGGIEWGWRFIAADAGYLYNSSLVGPEDETVALGTRFRLGIALASELFSGGSTRFSRSSSCCTNDPNSETACECKRTLWGVGVFLYYGNELYFHKVGDQWHVWDDGMLGLTLKLGAGL